ncbi:MULTISPECIES: nickel ABC transporter permease [Dethiosulfovibrio]|uniref:ABC transporter permease n=2 Tax=Dethiosulfovibrio TaxID=47054 RepID=A0ABS9EPN2_9BACT|nr:MULTISPECIES: nickel ABC transporter permease [Dethiosulfovibrio]MCF4113167.1 ABC transporter permease [Dethiosulfovibrio russensis]MCF4142231.1 ABC transporter permease [Dethiosulfovibrio marinus]MCF4144539.1 ABC transporter permease [Dethiosulfovibrio acidaminovorans]MEA3285645.1 nickel ABC transporter permease [Synergistota bacterium]
MFKYIFKRVLMLVPVLIGVTFIVFSMLYITPGDPARMVLGEQAPQESVDELRQEMGLNDPFFVQFGRYVYKAVVHGDIGRSYITKRPVVQEIWAAFPVTLKLSAIAMVIAMIVGIPCGIVSAIKQYSLFDNAVTIFAMIGISMPVFWLGILLILLFSVRLGWVPPSGFDSVSTMILPALTLGAQSVAIITRMTRSSMLEVIRQDYIRTVRAKGQRERVVIWKHALGNALIPVITISGIQFGILLGGAVLTELIFSIPGVGRLMVESIKMRDFPVVQGGVLFIAVAFCVVNLLVDLVYAWLDPRIKAQYVS